MRCAWTRAAASRGIRTSPPPSRTRRRLHRRRHRRRRPRQPHRRQCLLYHATAWFPLWATVQVVTSEATAKEVHLLPIWHHAHRYRRAQHSATLKQLASHSASNLDMHVLATLVPATPSLHSRNTRLIRRTARHHRDRPCQRRHHPQLCRHLQPHYRRPRRPRLHAKRTPLQITIILRFQPSPANCTTSISRMRWRHWSSFWWLVGLS